MAGKPRRVQGRTLTNLDPDQLIWILLVRESTDRERQLVLQQQPVISESAGVVGFPGGGLAVASPV
jgi:hypothetical protein